MLKRIHVNQFVIRSNRRDGRRDPPIRVKTYRENVACHEAEILGPSKLVYSPERPLSCGARLWLETRADVLVVDGGEQRLIS